MLMQFDEINHAPALAASEAMKYFTAFVLTDLKAGSIFTVERTAGPPLCAALFQLHNASGNVMK
jgi:hypothetical protein